MILSMIFYIVCERKKFEGAMETPQHRNVSQHGNASKKAETPQKPFFLRRFRNFYKKNPYFEAFPLYFEAFPKFLRGFRFSPDNYFLLRRFRFLKKVFKLYFVEAFSPF